LSLNSINRCLERLRPPSAALPTPAYDPCANWRAWAFLNLDEGREAINAINVACLRTALTS